MSDFLKYFGIPLALLMAGVTIVFAYYRRGQWIRRKEKDEMRRRARETGGRR